MQTVRLDRDHSVVTLTKEGRDLLESRRMDDDSRDRQAFYAGVPKPRELKHDAELYRAYTEEAERLRDEGANIHRIVLENDLKREYQEFLQERNRDRDDSDGRPDRDPLEIQDWADEFRVFLLRHAALLGRLPAWTLRIVVPPQFPDISQRARQVVWTN